MTFQSFVFWVFSAILLFASVRVITTRNSVQAALFLVLAFGTASALWILLEAEFLAIALILVYVGAVMVLFLFVVMMLDVDFVELRQGVLNYLPVAGTVGFIFMIELVFIGLSWAISPTAPRALATPIARNTTNTTALGLVLYTRYVYYFEAAGLVLLVAMIGAIVLTLRHKANVKRQNIAVQNARTKATAIEIRQVRPGQGI